MGKIDGKEIAKQIHEELIKEVEQLKDSGIKPCLAVIQVGSRADSTSYIRMKKSAAETVGIEFKLVSLPESVSESDLLTKIESINNDSLIHGLIVQLPLPDHIDEPTVTRAVSCSKDVDGFHVENVGKLVLRGQEPKFVSCTPKGCIELLLRSGVTITGKDVVVLGRSNIVGLPVAHLLLQQNATVTICHSSTSNLPEKCRAADILVVAIGHPEFVKGDWVKEGAVVIDVGINSVPDESRKSGYRLVGDVEFKSASQRASLITPVPGGVGPMT